MGQLQLEEGYLLYKCAKKIKDGIILEIGSYKGKSANFLLRGIDDGTTLHCVDTWDNNGMTEGKYNTYNIFERNIPESKKKQLIKHRGSSEDMAKKWDGKKIDLLFIDGDHSRHAVESDFYNWSKFVKKGSYILFHDYTNPCGVKDFVDELVSKGLVEKVDLVKSIYISRMK